MVGAFEDVPEAGCHEAQRGLVPARIEMHDAGIAVKLERADGAVGGRKRSAVETFSAQPIETRMDRELRMRRRRSGIQQHVEQLLVPVELEIGRERRRFEVRAAPPRRT